MLLCNDKKGTISDHKSRGPLDKSVTSHCDIRKNVDLKNAGQGGLCCSSL